MRSLPGEVRRTGCKGEINEARQMAQVKAMPIPFAWVAVKGKTVVSAPRAWLQRGVERDRGKSGTMGAL